MGQAGEASWFAVYTRPRQERTALVHLQRQRFECFLPMADNPYQRSSKGPGRAEPLFPRYLFLRAVPEQQNLAPVRSTRGVVSLVRAGFDLVRVPGAVVAGLMARRHGDQGLIRLDPAPLVPGQKARVFEGPLRGLEGIFRERCGATRSLLLLSLLGRETTIEVNALSLQSA